MKTIWKIAKTELKTLFYSPIAWLIIIIFTFQVSLVFTGIFDGFVRRNALGWSLYSATLSTFAGMTGLFTIVQNYLYLYIPLLTMGVMSREFSSGSIKLLYSSPLTNRQIILGKYAALVVFALSLTGILSLYGLYASATIVEVDIPVILTGLLGLFLLICAYAAVGLFMSSLTSYTVVSAMGTLAIFAMLSYIKTVGQEIEFVRDITYWLAISGRSSTFIQGMITSEDLIYFIVVIALFLGFTFIRLQAQRQKAHWYTTFGKYALITCLVMLIGYFSSKPQLMGYYDATRTKVNTLTKSSQEVVKQLSGKMTITTYTNMLEPNYWIAMPYQYKYDVDRFAQYLRFKPDIKLKYKYYYHRADYPDLDKRYPDLNDFQRMDTMRKINNWTFHIDSYDDIKKEADLSTENFRFVRSLESESGNQTFLRIFDDMMRLPSEREITAAFKRLTLARLPTVGFLTGHGERASSAMADRGYNMFAQEKTFRYALINQGFDFEDITLDRDIPEHIRILIIAEARKAIAPEQMARLEQYIERGGNLVIASEPGRQDIINPLAEKLGIRFLPGMLVKPTEKFQANLLLSGPTAQATAFSFHFDEMRKRELVLTTPTVGALQIDSTKGYRVTTLFTSDSTGSWNELETTNFIDDTARLNPAIGEKEEPLPIVVALSRKVGDREQRILVTGDSDWLSNGELMMNRLDVKASNFSLINGAFFWLTNEEVPIDMRRDPMPDRSLRIGTSIWGISNIGFKWLLPLLLTAIALFIWIRRKGK